MSYQEALEAAGATILAMNNFGDYQGTWIAKIKGNTGFDKDYFITGSYGSCSGCDAFQSEFDYSTHYVGDDYHSYFRINEHPDCERCKETKRKLADFGRSYLENPRDIDDLIQKWKTERDWDLNAQDVINWLEANR